MAKQGILISVADDQEGGNPKIVTPTEPLPVSLKADDGFRQDVALPDTTHETDSVRVLNEISNKLDILIEYQAMLHGVNLGDKT